jgi:calcium-dependent protein kinase
MVEISSFITEGQNIKDNYKITSCIGRGKPEKWQLGAFGEVRKCQHKQTKALRAVKIINKKLLEKEEMEKMLNEIDILRKMVRQASRLGPPEYS